MNTKFICLQFRGRRQYLNLHSVQLYDYQIIMNWKGLRNESIMANLRYYTNSCIGKIMKISRQSIPYLKFEPASFRIQIISV